MFAVGPHRVQTKSIDEVNYGQLLDGETADICYTDPPWSDRMMSFFGTMREKQAGQSGENITYEKMLRSLRDMIDNHVDGIVIVAASMDDDTTETILDPVLYNKTTQITQYRGGGELRKNTMIFAGTDPTYEWTLDVSMQYGLSLCKNCIAHAAQQVTSETPVLIDPMCGQGNAAVGALEAGCTFIGNEFNVKRANDCVEKIQAVRNRRL